MSTEFSTSKTKGNLIRAYVGECQTHCRYMLAKNRAEDQGQYAVAALFNFIARQEKEHADIFYTYLKEQCVGEKITVDGCYPVDDDTDVIKLLESAERDEAEEASTIYPDFARVAREEGVEDIAAHFDMIAGIEESHRQRFQRFHDMYADGSAFKADGNEKWLCLNCGYVHESDEAPMNCPVCGTERGNYIRLCMSTWGAEC